MTTAFPDRTCRLAVARGEILGLAGLVGSGRTSLARTLFGIDPVLGGEMRLRRRARSGSRSPRDAIAHGIYLVPEDRKRAGLVLDMPIVENITLRGSARLRAHGLLDHGAAEAGRAGAQRTRLRSRRRRVETPAVTLSGGNQQKVVLGKWLSMRPQVMIFDEPTRGIDVGAKSEIYELMRGLADGGVAILMISQRHGGGDRRVRPHRRDARGRRSPASSSGRSSASTTCCGSPSATQLAALREAA